MHISDPIVDEQDDTPSKYLTRHRPNLYRDAKHIIT
jgi:hypothetical protein